MSHYTGPEKRSIPRIPLTTFCPAFFAHGGQEYRALMIDLSEKGARFRLEEYDQTCDFTIGEEVRFTIKTPYGESICTGAVVWARHLDEHHTWGVKFTELPTDEKDPLICFMDSTF